MAKSNIQREIQRANSLSVAAERGRVSPNLAKHAQRAARKMAKKAREENRRLTSE